MKPMNEIIQAFEMELATELSDYKIFQHSHGVELLMNGALKYLSNDEIDRINNTLIVPVV